MNLSSNPDHVYFAPEGGHGEGLLRVQFLLKEDEDGYPPYRSERLWARRVGPQTFEVANIPVFVYDIGLWDIVSTDTDQGVPTFTALAAARGHSTVRVLLHHRLTDHPDLDHLRNLGCTVRFSQVLGLCAVDIPPDVPLGAVAAALKDGEAAGNWSYEIAADRHTTDATAPQDRFG